MVSVQVFSKSSGKPAASGRKVTVIFKGLLRGHTTAYTDGTGTAHVDADPGTGDVFVSGSKVYSGPIKGLVRVYA
jgi:hypothetical protein